MVICLLSKICGRLFVAEKNGRFLKTNELKRIKEVIMQVIQQKVQHVIRVNTSVAW